MVTAAVDFTEGMKDSISDWFDWAIPRWMFNYNSFEETENETLESIGVVALCNVAIALLLWFYWTCKCTFLRVVG